MNELIGRRELLRGGLAVGVGGLLLGGCRSNSPRWTPMDMSKLDAPRRPLPAGPTAAPPPAVTSASFMPRNRWTSSGPILSRSNPMNGISRITVHHDGMDAFTSRDAGEAARRLELIRRAHVGRTWADIGYHYMIDPAGRVWEGRSVSLQGAHVADNNEHNLGIMVMGNFDIQSPTPQALASLDGLVLEQMNRYRVSLSKVYTHRELMPTACPGYALQSHMLQARSRRGTLAQA